MARKDNRIKVIHKSNGGVSNARNVAIEQANGEYLMFIDSDDIVSNDLCKVLFEMLKNNNADISICNATHIFDDRFDFKKTGEIHCYSRDEAICQLWYKKLFARTLGKLYKKELFKNTKFTEGIIFEDVDIMHKLFYQCNKIVYGERNYMGMYTTKIVSQLKSIQKKTM